MELTNLYLKTEYSFLSSTIKLENLVASAKSKGFKSLCITDSNMYGVIKFYELCQKNHLKPIIGLKVKYLVNNTISSLLLYAVSYVGYVNLMKLASFQKIKNYVTLERLKKYGKEIICIIPGSENEAYNSLVNDKTYVSGLKKINELSQFFTKLYIGITKNKIDDHFKRDFEIISSTVYPMVGYFKTEILTKEENLAYKVLTELNKKEVKDNDFNYFHSKKELITEFKDYPELLSNIDEIIKQCNVKLEFNKPAYPKFKDNFNSSVYLYELAEKGLKKRIKNTNKNYEAYLNRLHYELNVIIKMGYADYFLIVWDFIKYAKNHDIMVGPGRGSSVSSLVAYVLGIIDIDPLEYNLIFERFLNIERVTMPDIDVDFEDDRRDEVIKYLTKRYGKEKVAHIITFSTYGTKNAVNDVSGILKLSEVRKKQILKNIDKGINNKLNLKDILKESEALQDLYNNYQDIKDVIDCAIVIEGLPKNKSTHASGIVVTETNLTNYVPVELNQDLLQTQYSGPDLEKLGLLKIDFLGLHNLTTLKSCIDSIKHDHPDFVLPTDLNDFKTFKLVEKSEFQGIFQLENPSMKSCIAKIKVSNFDELVQSMALNRPGAMEMIPTYADIKFGRKRITYLHPNLEPILKETKGIILYQEQIMMIARIFAGYSFGKADILRRAIAKKNMDLMLKEKNDFINGCLNNHYSLNVAEQIFNYILEFANYGFNKSHSVAYSYITYYTLYLKANYKGYFYATMLNDHTGDDEKMSSIYKEAINNSVVIYSPNINVSQMDFIAKDDNILVGLSKIKGLNKAKIEELIKNRPYNNFEDFVNKTSDFLTDLDYEKLIYSSALDLFKLTKKAMIENYPVLISRKKYAHIKTLMDITYKNDEFPYEYLLEKEKLTLGFNLRYNFFEQYKYLYQKFNLLKIDQLKKQNHHNSVGTLGIITNIKEIKTKNNELMAFGNIMDDVSEMEIVIFPRCYSELKIEIGKIVLIYGELQRKEDIQLVVNRIDKI